MYIRTLGALLAACASEIGLLQAASPDNGPNLEIQVQQTPIDDYGDYRIYPNANSERMKSYESSSQGYYQEASTQQTRSYPTTGSNQVVPQREAIRQADRPAAQQPVAAVEQTLSIIKPDAVGTGHIGDIISRFERSGLRVVALKMTLLSKTDAEKFYAVHKDRPFYPELVTFMSSGPVVALVLEGPDAIAKNRQMMGSTDPKEAQSGTLRADFAESKSRNAVHGSDSPQAAKEEISFFFKSNEIFKR